MGIKDFFVGFFRRTAREEPVRIMDKSDGYTYDTTTPNYELMRKLYRNRDKKFMLGAGFAAPAVNATAGFMGVPNFRAEDERVQEILDRFILNNTSEMLYTMIDALHLGDAYVWLTREDRSDPLFPEYGNGRIIFNRIPPEEVKSIAKNPLTGEAEAYNLETVHKWTDEQGVAKECVIKQRIIAGMRTIQIDGDKPAGIEEGDFPLPWKFLPIVHFKNNPDANMEFGNSELEPIIPYMRSYHDTLLSALKGSKMHSTPILQIFTKDPARFLAENYPDATSMGGGTYTIDVKGKEVFFFNDKKDDGAEYVEAKSSIGAANDILKKLFYCIVDASETPEFIFGVHTPAALASVKEQMPILINKVRRKREQYTQAWSKLARMVIMMEAQGQGVSIANAQVMIAWDTIDPRDTTDVANTLKTTVDALATAVNNGLMSDEAAIDFLRGQIDTMNEFSSDDPEIIGERERIVKSQRLRSRYQDYEGWLEEARQIEEIADALKKADAKEKAK